MSFRNPVTHLPASKLVGQIDPATQVATGIFPAGVVAQTIETAQTGKRIQIQAGTQDRILFVPASLAGLLASAQVIVDSDGSGNLFILGPQQSGHNAPALDLFVTNFGGGATLSADDYVSLQGGSGGVQVTGLLTCNNDASVSGNFSVNGSAQANGNNLLQALAGSGYRVESGSTTVTFTASQTSASKTVTYTTPFTGVPLTFTQINDGNGSAIGATTRVTTAGNASFHVDAHALSSISTSFTVDWVSIGV